MERPIELILVDDDPMDLQLLEMYCKKAQWKFKSFSKSVKALEYIENKVEEILVISDIAMPDLSGFDLLERLKSRSPNKTTPVVFASGSGGVDYPVRAMRNGAFDFLVKPVQFELFEARVSKAIERVLEKKAIVELQQNLFEGHAIENFVGTSRIIRGIYDTVSRVAKYDSTVLITGESGVGKERVARAIHSLSGRKGKSFVAVNCASIPESLVESELFGYQKGAFTGADRDKKGLVELSSGGILFLDEIGEIPLHLQAKLLRVLQEKVVRPVGGKAPVSVDLRVVCATHRNLEEMVKKKEFREDLYYRLNVIPVNIPPLRARKEDVKVLIPFLMRKLLTRWGETKEITAEAIDYLVAYDWPGNVREMENVLERAFVLSQGEVLSVKDFKLTEEAVGEDASLFNFNTDEGFPTLQEVELNYIREVMSLAATKDEAARILGIGRKTLYRKEEQIEKIMG